MPYASVFSTPSDSILKIMDVSKKLSDIAQLSQLQNRTASRVWNVVLHVIITVLEAPQCGYFYIQSSS